MARRAAALIQGLRPGTSPPPVRIPIVFVMRRYSSAAGGGQLSAFSGQGLRAGPGSVGPAFLPDLLNQPAAPEEVRQECRTYGPGHDRSGCKPGYTAHAGPASPNLSLFNIFYNLEAGDATHPGR